MDESVWSGVNSLLDNYVEARDDDIVIVVYTSDSREPAAWVSVAFESRGITVNQVWMAPLDDDGFHHRLRTVLPSPNELLSRLVILTFERDTMSHETSIRDLLSKYDANRCRVFRAISVCPSFFSDALRVHPRDLSARNTTILEHCMNAKRLRIQTTSGTDLSVTIDNERYRWISNRGAWRPGKFVILPAGEVATFPASIEGVLIADFAFNANVLTDRDARLEGHPVTVWVENGRAVNFECADENMRTFLDQCFQTYCAHIVGELGFGTNYGVDSSTPLNSHINERRPGVHLGFGNHNQDPKVAGYKCNLHLDLIAKGGMVWVDSDPEPLDLDHIIPSTHEHPTRYHEEDVNSPDLEDLDIDDCCGVLNRDGLQLFTVQPIQTRSETSR